MSEGMSKALASSIIARMGATGQPPELGVEHVNVGNESYLGIMQDEYLVPIKESGMGSAFKLVQAYFGGGKTHFLYLVRCRAWALGYPAAVVGLSPGECPFDDQPKVYAAVAREVRWPPSDPLVLPDPGIDVLLRTVADERVEAAGKESVRLWIDRQLRRANVASHSYRTAVTRFLSAYLDDRIDEEEALGAFLRGEDLSSAERKALGIRDRLDGGTAFRFLRSLVQILHALGAPGLLLCFDEMDKNLSFTQRRKRAIAENLRELIDRCGMGGMQGLVCLYAVPPEFMRNVVTEYPALDQRLAAPSALSVRSPQSVLIDLEDLDMPHEQVLVEIGRRILDVFCVATGAGMDRDLQAANATTLARTVLEDTWDVAQRRSFVKAVITLLYTQRADGEEAVSQDEAARLVRRAAEMETGMEEDGDDDDFENDGGGGLLASIGGAALVEDDARLDSN